MDTIFSVPMRQNNNNLLDSGHQLLSDWVTDVSNIQQINVRFDVQSMDSGTEIIYSHYLYNSSIQVKYGVSIITLPGRYAPGFSRGDMGNDTAVAVTVRTVGKARFSIDVVSFNVGEDVPEW